MNAVTDDRPQAGSRVQRAAIIAGAFVVGGLVATALILWAHYGSAVFLEIITAGVAFCL